MRQHDNTWVNGNRMFAVAICYVGLVFLNTGCSQDLQPQTVKKSSQISAAPSVPALQAGTRDSSGDEPTVVNVKRSGTVLASNSSVTTASLNSASLPVQSLDTKQASLLKCDGQAVESAGIPSAESQEQCEQLAPLKNRKP